MKNRLFIYGPQGVGKSALREKLLAETGTRREIHTTNYHPHIGGELATGENKVLVPVAGDEVWQLNKLGRVHSRRTL